jgi:hypothetical protein
VPNDDANTCSTRLVTAPDGTDIPVPVGGLGLADGSSVTIRDDASVQIAVNDSGAYYVTVNNADPSNAEAQDLFGELTSEGGITTLEHLASDAFSEVPELVFKGVGLLAGVLVSLFTSSQLTREVFIRTSLDTGQPVDTPPVTYALLI